MRPLLPDLRLLQVKPSAEFMCHGPRGVEALFCLFWALVCGQNGHCLGQRRFRQERCGVMGDCPLAQRMVAQVVVCRQ